MKGPSKIPATLRDFALKHRIPFGLSRGPSDYFYFIRRPGERQQARYMTASAKPTVANALALMRRWLRDQQ